MCKSTARRVDEVVARRAAIPRCCRAFVAAGRKLADDRCIAITTHLRPPGPLAAASSPASCRCLVPDLRAAAGAACVRTHAAGGAARRHRHVLGGEPRAGDARGRRRASVLPDRGRESQRLFRRGDPRTAPPRSTRPGWRTTSSPRRAGSSARTAHVRRARARMRAACRRTREAVAPRSGFRVYDAAHLDPLVLRGRRRPAGTPLGARFVVKRRRSVAVGLPSADRARRASPRIPGAPT